MPAGNANGEFAADRVWRNTGLPANAATRIGTGIVGWEWDAVPVQAQYLSRQPAGVKRLSSTDTTATSPSWLQDEGRQRSTAPPAGMAGTVNAVKYTGAKRCARVRSGHEPVGVGPGVRSRPADPASDVQHLLRHGHSAAHAGPA